MKNPLTLRKRYEKISSCWTTCRAQGHAAAMPVAGKLVEVDAFQRGAPGAQAPQADTFDVEHPCRSRGELAQGLVQATTGESFPRQLGKSTLQVKATGEGSKRGQHRESCCVQREVGA